MGPNLKSRTRKILAKEGREWLILLLSLLLAFFTWVIHNLSRQYQVYLQYRLEIRSDLPGRVVKSISEDRIVIRAEATGFYILEHRLFEEDPLIIDVPSDVLVPSQTSVDLYTVYMDSIDEKIYAALGNKVSIVDITTGGASFLFPRINTKKVPVIPKTSISYKDQYMMVGDISYTPDSVVIYGEERELSRIDEIYTESISLKELDESTKGVQKLVYPKNVEISEDRIYYSIVVDRFVEESIDVPVKVVGAPPVGAMVVIPPTVRITYRQSFSYRKRYGEKDFSVAVDFLDYLYSLDSKVVPKIEKKPEDIYDISISPKFVECIYIDE